MALRNFPIDRAPKRRTGKVVELPQKQTVRISMSIGAEPGSAEALAAAKGLRELAKRVKVGSKGGATAVVRAERNRR